MAAPDHAPNGRSEAQSGLRTLHWTTALESALDGDRALAHEIVSAALVGAGLVQAPIATATLTRFIAMHLVPELRRRLGEVRASGVAAELEVARVALATIARARAASRPAPKPLPEAPVRSILFATRDDVAAARVIRELPGGAVTLLRLSDLGYTMPRCPRPFVLVDCTMPSVLDMLAEADELDDTGALLWRAAHLGERAWEGQPASLRRRVLATSDAPLDQLIGFLRGILSPQ